MIARSIKRSKKKNPSYLKLKLRSKRYKANCNPLRLDYLKYPKFNEGLMILNTYSVMLRQALNHPKI